MVCILSSGSGVVQANKFSDLQKLTSVFFIIKLTLSGDCVYFLSRKLGVTNVITRSTNLTVQKGFFDRFKFGTFVIFLLFDHSVKISENKFRYVENQKFDI